MLATIAFPTARYLIARSHLLNLFAVCLLFVCGMVAVFAAATLIVPLLTALGGLLWTVAVVVAPVVLKLTVGLALIAGFAVVTLPR